MHLISNDQSTCVGCNRCIRVCPIEDANIAYSTDEGIRVKIDEEKCIVCGACIKACRHSSRNYTDDTERFFTDLGRGEPISIFVAPANRAQIRDWERVLAWLKRLGVRKIYDVSLGADICTWAHIRFIQKHGPQASLSPIITQPCPAIVNYVLKHRHELLPYLSPVHSPMLCTAVYMRKYEGVKDKIAAISPCIAKSDEFAATGLVSYNVTLKRLNEYIEQHFVDLPDETAAFDHIESGLGSLYSMPGGLKENVEFFLGKRVRVDKSEGQSVVYHALDEFLEQDECKLPAVFDVLNCAEGCNLGTGCDDDKSVFEVNTTMSEARTAALLGRSRQYFDELYEEYDRRLKLDDFIRVYKKQNIVSAKVTDEQIAAAYEELGKQTFEQQNFDCGACGSDTCKGMARKVSLGVNTPSNCIEKARSDIMREHASVLELQQANLDNMGDILGDITSVKGLSDSISESIHSVNDAVEEYHKMAQAIESIAQHINIISINASVEAARAGQHGRTFAVVAEEIRALANSSKATVERTEEVSEKAMAAIGSMGEMVTQIGGAVDKAYGNISEITTSTEAVLK